jgi:bacterioferritin
MQGNKKVIDVLNAQLAAELTAISQYIVHSEMCANWGYDELSKYIKGRAREEMSHAEKLIERIIFLEGRPIVSDLNTITIGARVPDMFENDHSAEETAIETYNAAIQICVNAADNGTRKILEEILADEERHINDIEENQSQIAQTGIENYLTEQI